MPFFELITQYLAQMVCVNVWALVKILDFSFARSAKPDFFAQKASPCARSAKLFAHSFFILFSPESLHFPLPLPVATNRVMQSDDNSSHPLSSDESPSDARECETLSELKRKMTSGKTMVDDGDVDIPTIQAPLLATMVRAHLR